MDNPEEEPVYNSDVAWPDNAAIIRAHDRNVDDSVLGTPADLIVLCTNITFKKPPNGHFTCTTALADTPP